MGVWPVIGLRVCMSLPLGDPLFCLSAGLTELRFFHPYVPLANAKIVDYFVIFPVVLSLSE